MKKSKVVFYTLLGLTIALGQSVLSSGTASAEMPIKHSPVEALEQSLRLDASLQQLHAMAVSSRGDIDKIYFHWSAMPYDRAYPSYHVNIGRFGEIYITCNSLTELKAHTWHRNSRAVGVSLDSMYGASYDYPRDMICWGSQPMTDAQLKSLALVIANLADGLGIDINKNNVMSHYEAAILDDYAPGGTDPDVRWDILRVIDPATGREVDGSNYIRNSAKSIQVKWNAAK